MRTFDNEGVKRLMLFAAVAVVVARFRCEFESDGSPLEFDVTGDERDYLALDGDKGRGRVITPVAGEFVFGGAAKPLVPGVNEI